MVLVGSKRGPIVSFICTTFRRGDLYDRVLFVKLLVKNLIVSVQIFFFVKDSMLLF